MPVAPIISNHNRNSDHSQRHFSSFPMTGHLHNSALRLVSLNPSLSVTTSFQRVPEIPDGFEYRVYISRTTEITEVINLVMEELGLTKSLPIPGAGNVEYVVEEVWIDESNESAYTGVCGLLVTDLPTF